MSSESPTDTLPARQPNQHPPALTKLRQDAFLALLQTTGNIRKTCELLDIAPQSPYEWASRSSAFAKRFEKAKERGERVLLDEYEDIVDRRVNAYHLDQQSAVLTMFRMKRLDPRYRENAVLQVNATGPVAMQLNFAPPADKQLTQADEQAEPENAG